MIHWIIHLAVCLTNKNIELIHNNNTVHTISDWGLSPGGSPVLTRALWDAWQTYYQQQGCERHQISGAETPQKEKGSFDCLAILDIVRPEWGSEWAALWMLWKTMLNFSAGTQSTVICKGYWVRMYTSVLSLICNVMHFIFKDISEKILYLTDFKLQPVCSPPGIFDLQASTCLFSSRYLWSSSFKLQGFSRTPNTYLENSLKSFNWIFLWRYLLSLVRLNFSLNFLLQIHCDM